jgi:hypothetical protein
MRLQKDLREFIALLNSNKVEYVIVGAFALAFHGRPRYTGDIDILVRTSPENAANVENAITEFGFSSSGLRATDFRAPGQVVQLGRAPNRIDVLTSISGVSFDDVWANRVVSEIDGLQVAIIGRKELVANKKATGRAQDRADLESLGEL